VTCDPFASLGGGAGGGKGRGGPSASDLMSEIELQAYTLSNIVRVGMDDFEHL